MTSTAATPASEAVANCPAPFGDPGGVRPEAMGGWGSAFAASSTLIERS
jgi:hypothetical protein